MRIDTVTPDLLRLEAYRQILSLRDDIGLWRSPARRNRVTVAGDPVRQHHLTIRLRQIALTYAESREER